MTIEQLIAVLQEMNQEREVISKVEFGKKVRGVSTAMVDGKAVAVIL